MEQNNGWTSTSPRRKAGPCPCRWTRSACARSSAPTCFALQNRVKVFGRVRPAFHLDPFLRSAHRPTAFERLQRRPRSLFPRCHPAPGSRLAPPSGLSPPPPSLRPHPIRSAKPRLGPGGYALSTLTRFFCSAHLAATSLRSAPACSLDSSLFPEGGAVCPRWASNKPPLPPERISGGRGLAD